MGYSMHIVCVCVCVCVCEIRVRNLVHSFTET